MIKNIVHTVGSKLFIAILSFVTLLLNSNTLGTSGLGTISLLVLSITIILLISNLVHTGIIYFASRHPAFNLFIISYIWSFVSLGIAFVVQKIFHLFPEDMAEDIYYLAFLQAGIVIHLNLFLGKEKIKTYNFFSILQSVLTVGALLFYFFVLEVKEVSSFIHALYLAYASCFFLSFFRVIPLLGKLEIYGNWLLFKETLLYGFYIQSANVFQLLNYRISYFILDAFAGRASLGLYSAGVQLSEALLLPGKSISTVQYARISAKKNQMYAVRVSLLFMKISVLLSTLGTLVLLLLPAEFFSFLLGEGFGEVKYTIIAMSLGILALSAEIVLSHYFSGTGRQKKNSISSLIGFLVTLIFAFLLIPRYGAIGAGITSSLTFISMLLYLLFQMKSHPGMSMRNLIPNESDKNLVIRLWRKSRTIK